MMEKDQPHKKTNGSLRGKKVYAVSEDANLLDRLREITASHGGVLFHSAEPRGALAGVMSKNPDLIIYDDRMPNYNGAKVLSLIKRWRPHDRILFLSRTRVPLRSIDVSAQGVSFTVPFDANPQEMYNAVKHCLGVASVPRVETQTG